MIVKYQRISLIFLLVFIFMLLASSEVHAEKAMQVIPEETKKNKDWRGELDKEIDDLSERMLEINDWIYHNPEPGFLEFRALSMLTEELKTHGFSIEEGVPGLDSHFDQLKIVGGFPPEYAGPPGLPTAFKAKYRGCSDHPVIGIMVEYDALRGNPPFHGCQHNMQGPKGIGAAIALSRVIEKHKIPGSVWVIGTPAEEVGPPAWLSWHKRDT